MLRRFCLSALLMLLLQPWPIDRARGEGAIDYIALIIELQGTVRITRKNETTAQKAVWGSYVFEGDRVETGPQSRASLLFSNGNIIALNANGSITLMKQSEREKLTPPTKQSKAAARMYPDPERIVLDSLAYQKLLIRRSKNGAVHIYPGVRSGSELLRYPRRTAVRERQPRFEWHTATGAEHYRIDLYDSERRLWSITTSDTTLKFPRHQPLLNYGRAYTWTLSRIDGLDTTRLASTFFRILDFDDLQNVIRLEKKIERLGADFERSYCDFLKAVTYEKYGLKFEAIEQFKKIQAMNPESLFPHEAIARLYADLGLYQQALFHFANLK